MQRIQSAEEAEQRRREQRDREANRQREGRYHSRRRSHRALELVALAARVQIGDRGSDPCIHRDETERNQQRETARRGVDAGSSSAELSANDQHVHALHRDVEQRDPEQRQRNALPCARLAHGGGAAQLARRRARDEPERAGERCE
jgi:hypothetical protein